MYREDPFSGRKEKINDTPRNIYLNHIMYNFKLVQLIEHSKKKKINIIQIIKEKEKIDNEYNQELKPVLNGINKSETKPEINQSNLEETKEHTQIEVTIKKVTEFDSILEKIDKEFDFDKIKNEKNLEDYLWMFLKTEFKNKIVERQYKTERGIIDIVIDNKFAIELKIIENNKTLENLEGQVSKYLKVFGKNNLALVLLKTSKVDDNKLDEHIKEYEEKGAKVILLDRGTINRRKKKSITYIIKK